MCGRTCVKEEIRRSAPKKVKTHLIKITQSFHPTLAKLWSCRGNLPTGLKPQQPPANFIAAAISSLSLPQSESSGDWKIAVTIALCYHNGLLPVSIVPPLTSLPIRL